MQEYPKSQNPFYVNHIIVNSPSNRSTPKTPSLAPRLDLGSPLLKEKNLYYKKIILLLFALCSPSLLYITLQKMCEITNVTFEMPYTTNE